MPITTFATGFCALLVFAYPLLKQTYSLRPPLCLCKGSALTLTNLNPLQEVALIFGRIFSSLSIMTDELKEYLRSNITIDTLEDLCTSISKVGPYVSGVSMAAPISANRFRFYLSVAARRDSYRQFHIKEKRRGANHHGTRRRTERDFAHTGLHSC